MRVLNNTAYQPYGAYVLEGMPISAVTVGGNLIEPVLASNIALLLFNLFNKIGMINQSNYVFVTSSFIREPICLAKLK
ncbi:hypothetical protein [Vibrio phage vB_VhaP_PG11]|nr:hypothetical protein [Vibrio phage vB_VhaP_PG11]